MTSALDHVTHAAGEDAEGFAALTAALNLGFGFKDRVRHRLEGWTARVWYAQQCENWGGVNVHVFREDTLLHDVVSWKNLEKIE